MDKKEKMQTEFDEQEQEKRDKLLRKLLTTPPKRYKDMKKGNAKISKSPDKKEKPSR